MTGVWQDATLGFHGYQRSRDGHVSRFDAPGAIAGAAFLGTRPTRLNGTGEVSGYRTDANGLNHGLMWMRDE